MIAATDVTISSPNFTLIGSATTNFKIYKMGSAKSVNALLAEYGIKPIYNVTQDLAYDNNALNTAVSAATDGDEIELNGDVEVSSNLSFGKGLTIVPVNADRTITISTSLTGSYFAFGMSTASKTVEIGSDTYGLTFDGQSTTLGDRKLFEVTNGQVKFKKVTFENVYTSSSQGVLCVKSNSGANITLTDVAFNGCQATASGAGVIFCGTDDALVLSKKNTFTGCTGYDIYLEKRFKIDGTNGVTNTAPISLFVKTSNIALGGNVINNALSSEVTQFIIKNDGYGLYRTEDGRGFIKCCEGYPLQVTSAGAATLCLPYASTIPTGVTCYTTLSYTSGDNITATAVTGGTLSANTPVLVIADEGLYYMLNSTKATTATEFTASATPTEGVLTGVYQETTVPADNYILTKHGDAVGFRKADGLTNKVQPYRAYLTASYSADPAAREFLGIDFDGDVTAINAVEKKTVTDDGEVYNLQGVRMTGGNLPKGIYVKNGKKFVIK